MRRKVLLFLLFSVLLSRGFYGNSRHLIEESYYQHWQEVFEFFIVGRLSLSQQEGLFSAGSLLVLGNADSLNVGSRVINAQYDTYKEGGSFDRYWVYRSNPGLIGLVLGVFDRFTSFSPGFNLKLFRISVAVFNGVLLGLFMLWVYEEIDWLAALLNLLLISFSPWITLLGGSIYWQLWVFYLPMVVFLFWLKRLHETDSQYPSAAMLWTMFLTVLLKILLTGFEFITTFLLMSTVPFVFYALKGHWQFKVFFQRALKLGVVFFGAVFTGLLVLAFQITAADGSNAVQHILYAFEKRSFGSGTAFEEPYASAIRAPFIDVFMTYLKGPAIAFESFSGQVVIDTPFLQSYLFFMLIFVLVGSLVLMLKMDAGKRYAPLLLTTLYAFLPVLSWLVIFKAHAYIHVNLDFIIWQMPFMFFGMALCGKFLQDLFPRLLRKRQVLE